MFILNNILPLLPIQFIEFSSTDGIRQFSRNHSTHKDILPAYIGRGLCTWNLFQNKEA